MPGGAVSKHPVAINTSHLRHDSNKQWTKFEHNNPSQPALAGARLICLPVSAFTWSTNRPRLGPCAGCASDAIEKLLTASWTWFMQRIAVLLSASCRRVEILRVGFLWYWR